MKKNRIILILFVIACGVFASFYGGYVSYGLFYFSLLIPAISLIYLGYVYLNFRVYQLIDHKTVVKGEQIPYQFILSNENILAFTSVRVTFKGEYSKVERMDADTCHCLFPGDRIEERTTVSCFYRGEYLVGADKIYLSDYFNLFQVKYQAPSPITVKVLPRILHLRNLKIATEFEGKTQKYSPMECERIPDVEVRNYVPGDRRKMIHWKVAAKQGKLMTRKYTDEPKTEILIFMDFRKKDCSEKEAIILEDKMIETFLAISNFYFQNKTPIKAVYDYKGIHSMNVIKKIDFDQLFALAKDVYFRAASSVTLLMEYASRITQARMFQVVITHFLTDELLLASHRSLQLGNDVVIVYIGDEDSSWVYDKLDAKIAFIPIPSEGEITSLLEG